MSSFGHIFEVSLFPVLIKLFSMSSNFSSDSLLKFLSFFVTTCSNFLLKWLPLLGKLLIWSFQLSQALKPSTAYRQKNSREADHKRQTGDVGFGVLSRKVTLLACGSGLAQIVFLYFIIKSNIYFVSYTLSTRFSLFIYRITSTGYGPMSVKCKVATRSE